MAWPDPWLPLDSWGEVADPVFVLLSVLVLSSFVLELPELVLDVPVLELPELVIDVLDAALDCACAAAAAANVPARPATTSPTVIAVVRRSPLSRSMDRLRPLA